MKEQDDILPDEIIRPGSRRGIVLTLVGSVVIVLIVNFALAHFMPRNPGYAVVRDKWAMLLNQKRPVDTLVLGDSSGYLGVIPAELEAKLKGPAINYCSIGAMLSVNDAWMLDAYLEKFPPPKRVILVHVYDIWATPVTPVTMSNVPTGKNWRFNLKTNLTLKQKARILLTDYFPLYSENQTISSYILQPWLDRSNVFSGGLESGFCPVETGNPLFVQSDTKIRLKNAQNQNFQMTGENRQALEYMVSLAKEKGFKLYVVNSPLYEKLYDNAEFQRYYAQTQTELKKLTDETSWAKVLFGEPQLFPIEEMGNSNHLLHSGARKFSSALADSILELEQRR